MAARSGAWVVMAAGLSACCFSPVNETLTKGANDAGGHDGGALADAGPNPFCSIGGSDYSDGILNPLNDCQSCQAEVTQATWTDLPVGSSCSGGTCASGVCFAADGCWIDGHHVPPGGMDSSGCLQCNPALSATAWSHTQDGTLCGGSTPSHICYSGLCQLGCFISGTFYAPDVQNIPGSCQSCRPSVSTSSWSNLPAGAPCGGGNVCDANGTCGPQLRCTIGGSDYPRGAANPTDPSQCCSPTLDTNSWSYRLQDGGIYWSESQPLGIAIGDFNGDGFQDFATLSLPWKPNDPTGKVGVFLRKSDGTFGPPTSYSTCAGLGLQSADLNGDHLSDLVVAGCYGTLTMLLADGTGGFVSSDVQLGRGPDMTWSLGGNNWANPGICTFPIQDFDGDGLPDVLLGGSAGPGTNAAVFFLKGLGGGALAAPVLYLVPGVPSQNRAANSSCSVVVGDLRGSGEADLVSTTNLEALGIFFGNGAGVFTAQTSIGLDPLLPPLGPVALGDFDGDGFADIGIAGFNLRGDDDLVSIQLGNGDGTFRGQQLFDHGGVTMTFADLDGDGRSEALGADFVGNALTVLWHQADGGVAAFSLPAGFGPTEIAAGDLDGDGTPDVIVDGTSGQLNVYVNSCR